MAIFLANSVNSDPYHKIIKKVERNVLSQFLSSFASATILPRNC